MSTPRIAGRTWADFERAAPDMARAGRRLLYTTEVGEGLLATVRDDAPPRLHPIWLAIVDGHLYAFILASAKRRDLEIDGRYALHNHRDPSAPSEFSVRGQAHRVDEAEVRSGVGAGWYFQVDDSSRLFEFGIDAAVLGVRDDADEWPPRYSTWRADDLIDSPG